MIRKWFKKIMMEAIRESIPPCHITVVDSEKSNIKLRLKGGLFINSKINIAKAFANEVVDMDHVYIEQGEHDFFIKMEKGEK